MTEHEWLTSCDPQRMLNFLQSGFRPAGIYPSRSFPSTDQLLRLFAVACCRSVWEQLRDERSRQAVDVAEAWAEGRITSEEALTKRKSIVPIPGEWVPMHALNGDAANGAERIITDRPIRIANDPYPSKQTMADLLRHTFGNPYKFIAISVPSFSPEVVQLAQQVYDGTDVSFALHDALQESGQPEIAQHFADRSAELAEVQRQLANQKAKGVAGMIARRVTGQPKASEENDRLQDRLELQEREILSSCAPHYKGCAVLDFILGKR